MNEVNLNTTKTIGKTSTVLGDKCENTKKNMKALLAKAGCKECKSVKMRIPMFPGEKDDVLTIGLNGVMFYFKKGETVEVPEPLEEILKNTGNI